MLIGASLANGVGANPSDVRVFITAPSLYGLVPRSGVTDRGQMTIIDVPASPQINRQGSTFDINMYLRNEAVRVPPFVAAIRQANGQFLEMRPRERSPTAWQLRLLAIFTLSLLAVAPLAWLGAHRWTRSIRLLADRLDKLNGQDAGDPVTSAADAKEVKALERAFEALHQRIRAQIDERLQMLTAVAHDLRTPLTSLRIRSEDVAQNLRVGFVRDIARLEQMIDGILAFARSQNAQGDRGIVDFSRLVEDLVIEAKAQGNHITFDAEPVWIEGNAIDLSRAVDNLLSNASRYGGRSTVTLSKSGGCAMLRVVDDGPGVPDELIPRLTEPFFRTEQSRSIDTGGIGLGLATVKAIVDGNAGSLRFENTVGGFAVEMSLMAHDPDESLRQDPAAR